jgi:hypothetical protein
MCLVRLARANLSFLSSSAGRVIVVLEALAAAVVATVHFGDAEDNLVDDADDKEEEEDEEDEQEMVLFLFVDTAISSWKCSGWAEGDFSHALDFKVSLVGFVRVSVVASGQQSSFCWDCVDHFVVLDVQGWTWDNVGFQQWAFHDKVSVRNHGTVSIQSDWNYWVC